MSSIKQWGVASVAGLILAGSISAPVLAEERVISGNDSNIPLNSIEQNRNVTLRIEKSGPNFFDDVKEGQRPPAPVSGAIFNLYVIESVDVTTPSGREAAKDMTVDAARSQGLNLIGTAETNAKGAVTFNNLRPGLYLIEEIASNNEVFDYRLSSPKLLILPLGAVDGTSFTYDNVVVVKSEPTPNTPPATTPDRPSETPETSRTTPPSTPGEPPQESTTPITVPPSNPPRPWLPETGSNVLWAFGLGAILIALGATLARGNKRTSR